MKHMALKGMALIMEPIVSKWMFVCFFVFSSMSYAHSLVERLNHINLEADQVEIYAANCLIEVKEGDRIVATCLMASDLVGYLNDKLSLLLATDEARVKHDAVALYVKAIRIKLVDANDHLTDAKIYTGNYRWTSSVIPAIHQK
jgi:hypothetical protein